jgi:predicted RND superfamily exporter protein
MEKDKLVEIVTDAKNKSNKDLFLAVNELYEEFEKTKKMVVDLTRHLESVEVMYNKVNEEIEKRIKKWIAGTALMFIIYYLIKSGLAKKVIVDFILKSRLVRWVLLLLFNYRLSPKSSPVKKVL